MPDMAIDYPNDDPFRRMVKVEVVRDLKFDETYPYLDESSDYKRNVFLCDLKTYLCNFLNWMIYGLKGFENISWMVLSQYMLQPVLFSKYLGILLGLAFQALLSLCAITLCVSAYQDSSFGAVIIAAACWGLPVLIRMFFGGIIWLIVDSMPIFLVMTGIVNDIYEIWYIVLGINVCFAIGCLVKGLVSYKTKQFA